MKKVKNLSFNTKEYEPFIDFLKAYSIFCVVLAHCLPIVLYDYTLFRIWGDMQVPMFVLIQTFHAYKQGVCPSINIRKIHKRIIAPYIIIQTFILLVLLSFSSESAKLIVLKSVIGGVMDQDHIIFGYIFK